MVRWRFPAGNALFALFVGGMLVYGAVFAWRLLDRFDVVNLVRVMPSKVENSPSAMRYAIWK